MNGVPRWRIVAGCVVLAILGIITALFAPVYIRNFRLQNYVDGITRHVENYQLSDDVLRFRVLQRAQQLDLPVTAENVHILRVADRVRVDVRYAVTIHAPLYTVALHFYPGAGSR